MNTWFLGITGGIGSGKTTVANLFSAYNINIIDADHISRVIVAPDKQALTKIVEHFGQTILSTNKQLDRAKLRDIIFHDSQQRYWLEQLLHPLITQEIIEQQKKATSPYAILVSPLLFESNQHLLVDRILVVDTPESLQMTRASQRDKVPQEQIKTIIRSQLSRTERLIRADDVIINDQDLSHLQNNVKRLHEFYLTLHLERKP